MILRKSGVAVFVALVITLIAAVSCGEYQTSDLPICGDVVIPDGHTCALWPAPCGCAVDQKCTRTLPDSAFVCGAPGAKGVDASCTDDSECAKGTMCDGTRCRQTCFETLDCGTDEAVRCTDWRDPNFRRIAGSCARACDPVRPRSPFDPRLETCRADESCIVTTDEIDSTSACVRTGGKRGLGMSCTTDADCAPGGLGCAIVGTAGKCVRLCFIDDTPSTCSGGAKCSPLTVGATAETVLDRAIGGCP